MDQLGPIGETDLLLVVDVQNDFCPGGRLAVPDGDAVVPAVNRIAQKFANVVLTQDWHPRDHLSFASNHAGKAPFATIEAPHGTQVLWPDHCVQGTVGAELHAELSIRHAMLIVRKGMHRAIDSYSAFYENDRRTPTGLLGYVRERGITRIVLAGLALDYCVRFSAEDAHGAGFATVVVEDACRGIDLDGSVAATHKAFTERGIACIDSLSIR